MNYKHIIMSIFLLLSLQAYSQGGCVDTVFVNTTIRTEGSLKAVDITVINFNDIQSLQFGLSYNTDAWSYDSSGNYNLSGSNDNSINGSVAGEIRFLWFDNTGVNSETLPDGSGLVTLYFNELSTSDPNVEIVPFGLFVAEASNQNQEILCINSIGSSNGGGGTTGGTQDCLKLNLDDISTENVASFSVSAFDFTNLDVLVCEINYDQSRYTYNNANNFGLAGLSETSITGGNGTLIVEWVNPALNGISLANGSVLFDITFDKIDDGSASFIISPSQSPISVLNDSNEVVCFIGDIANVNSGNGGNPEGCIDTVYLDLVATNGAADLSVDFISYNFENIVGLQFTIDYDPNHMTFIEESDVATDFNAMIFFESSPGKIGVSWIDFNINQGQNNPNGESLFTLNFQASSSTQSTVKIVDSPVAIEITRANGFDIIEELCLNSSDTDILSEGALLSGYIMHDLDGNCVDDDNTPLKEWIVQFSNTAGEFYSSTDENGYYQALVFPGTYTVTAIAPNNLWTFCVNDQVSITANNGDLDEVDFLAQAEYNCPLMYVDLSTPFLRRCFDNTYKLNYCNYGTTAAEDVYIEVALDDDLIFEGTDFVDYTIDASTNVLTFNIGDMGVNECLSLTFEVNVSCEAVLGATHCAQAVIYPTDDCSDDSNSWNGASLRVQGTCDGDSVRFTIKNNGVGDMLMPSEFIVIEDDVMFNSDQINLPAGQIQEVAYEATGVTYRVEVDQVASHPGQSNPAAFVEGCDPDNDQDYSTGFALMFPQDDNDPWVDIDCQENIGSYDPNDKTAFPKGYGAEQYIKKNTNLEYKIRFQNTGTDTAFKVVIIDTLSANVDVSTFRVGTASHDYQLVIRNQEVKFIFNDIQLVDSFKNEPESHGFITYHIQQKPDLADGNEILNRAAIYFDFNDPIITNTAFHEIGSNFVDIVNSTESSTIMLSSQVYPHPMTSRSFIKLDSEMQRAVQLRIVDAHGRTIRLQSQYGNLIPIHRDGLVNGMYYYEVRTDGVLLSSGKLVIQ